MKINNKADNWVELVKKGQLDRALEVYLAQNSAFHVLRFADFRRTCAALSTFLIFLIKDKKFGSDHRDDAVDLSAEFLIFWKFPNSIGRMLLTKIFKHLLIYRVVPTRAVAWYAHWLVFQGRYLSAGILFRFLANKVPKGSRLHGEILSLIGNYYYSREKLDLSLAYHRKSNDILKSSGDKFFQMFNLGTSAKTYADLGNLPSFNKELLSNYDHLDPSEPDERYGMRVLIYGAYLNFIAGNIDLGKQFYLTGEKSYQISGSSLDKGIYCIYKSAIMIFYRDLIGARESIQLALEHLQDYGQYVSYEKLARSIKEHLSNGGEAPQIIQNLLLKEDHLVKSDLESWYFSFFSKILPVIENFLESEIEDIVPVLEEATNSKIHINMCKQDVKTEDINQAKFEILDRQEGGTLFLLDLFHRDNVFQLTLKTNFKQWRNPLIVEALRSTLILLQNISKQGQLKRITFQQAQKIKENEVARRIAHDIKSPLASLQVAFSNLSYEAPDAEVIKFSMQRLEDITNSLTRKCDFEVTDKKNKILIKSFMDTLVSSKRFEYVAKGIVIQLQYENDSAGKYIYVNDLELGRTISNIINNAAEAYEKEGIISIKVHSTNSKLFIDISDYGCGIEPKNLERIFEKDYTSKENGSGLGLFYGKQYVEAEGGTLNVQSELNIGTTMSLMCPQVAPPAWIRNILFLHSFNRIVLIDDFKPNLELMKGKLLRHCSDKEIFTFTDLDEVSTFIKNDDTKKTFYFFDYDFVNSTSNGLNCIIDNKITSRSVLATHQHENDDLVSRCLKEGVRIIPKVIFNDIRIVNKAANIFIADDEKYFLKAMRMKLDDSFNVYTFEKSEDLLAFPIHEIEGESFFFIDQNFKGSELKGSDVIASLISSSDLNIYNISEDSTYHQRDTIKLRKSEVLDLLI